MAIHHLPSCPFFLVFRLLFTDWYEKVANALLRKYTAVYPDGILI